MKQQHPFRLALLLCFAAIIVAIVPLAVSIPAWAAGTNTVAIAPVTVQPGSTGSFTIDLTNSDAVSAGEIRFLYDSTIGLTVTDVTAAARLTGFTISPSINATDPTQVKVSVLFYNLNSSTVVSGDGAILTVSYTIAPNATGTTALDITKALLSDSAVNALAVTISDGTLTIGQPVTPTFTPTPITPTPTPITPTPTPITPTDTPTTPTDTPITPTDTPITPTPTLIIPTNTPGITDTPTNTATPDNRDDLFAFDYELWSEPFSPAAQEAVKVGLVVHRLRGKTTLQNVVVQLAVEDPTGLHTELGTVVVPLLGTHTQEISTYQQWTPPIAGEYTLIAHLDPADQVPETDETNNVITRTLLVLAPAVDRVPPRVTGFTINDGAATTGAQTVSLQTTATDPDPGSGVASLLFIEFEYLPSVNRWTPIHVSPWLDYTTIRQGTTWTVTAEAGAKYLQTWAMDQAMNIASHPGKAYINYQPTTQRIVQDATHFYRYQLQQGERLTVHLDATSGDPDLAVWAPDYETRAPWVSQATQSPDVVTLVAPLAGLYQVEVRGHSAAQYRLSIEITADGAQSALNNSMVVKSSNGEGEAKPQPNQPYLALDSAPDIYVPPSPSTTSDPTPTATPTVVPTVTPTATPTGTATPTPTPTATTTTSEAANQIYLPVVQQ